VQSNNYNHLKPSSEILLNELLNQANGSDDGFEEWEMLALEPEEEYISDDEEFITDVTDNLKNDSDILVEVNDVIGKWREVGENYNIRNFGTSKTSYYRRQTIKRKLEESAILHSSNISKHFITNDKTPASIDIINTGDEEDDHQSISYFGDYCDVADQEIEELMTLLTLLQRNTLNNYVDGATEEAIIVNATQNTENIQQLNPFLNNDLVKLAIDNLNATAVTTSSRNVIHNKKTQIKDRWYIYVSLAIWRFLQIILDDKNVQ
jgi:hypothetical protein